jgi:hypothetical protein
MKALFHSTRRPQNKVKIYFLGQCIAAGFSVGEANAYPTITRALLESRFPNLDFDIEFKPLLHPTGLKPLLKASLAGKPDIIFLSLPAIFATTAFRVNSLYLLYPDMMNLARGFIRKIESAVRRDSRFAKLIEKKSVLMPTMLRPAVKLEDYQRLIEEALLFCRQTSPCRLVMMGPGGFNLDTREKNELTPEIFDSLNQIIIEIGKRSGIAVVNANDAMAEQDSRVFLRDNQRWSDEGHQLMAQELTSVLALEISKLKYLETT